MNTKRGEKFDVTTLAGLLDWHEQNIPSDSEYHEKPLEAACWWAAYQEARVMQETNRTKDLAQFLIAGYDALATHDRLRESLSTMVQEKEDELQGDKDAHAKTREHILRSLRNFWLEGGEG